MVPHIKESSWLGAALRTPGGLVGGVVVAMLLLLAVIAPMLWGEQAATIDPANAELPPSAIHPFGTDELGRDVLLRVLVGTRLTLLLTFGAVIISTVLGIFLGVLAAVLGPKARQVLYQLTATATAFPALMLALLIATMFGRSGIGAMIGIAIAGAPSVARVTMNLAVSAAGSDYVANARVIGVRGPRLLLRYIVPNVIEPVLTLTILSTGQFLLVISALSFLGLGVQPPQWDWGQLMSSALRLVYVSPVAALGPGLAIVLAGVSFNLLGEALAEGVDPRNRHRLLEAKRRRTWPVPATKGLTRSLTTERLPPPDDTVLAIDNLRISTRKAGEQLELVRGVSLEVKRGELVGLVGESGSGKSLVLSAMASLLPNSLEAQAGRHVFGGTDLIPLSLKDKRRAFGAKLSMIFQDPMSSLNPVATVGSMLDDKLRTHSTLNRRQRKEQVLEALADVGLDDPARQYKRHPHQLSGGQRQRVMIAMSMLGPTEVLLADEPTTALDVSVQAQIVELLRDLNKARDVAIVLVSHDLALVSQLCDRILVMYGGRIVESGTTEQIVTAPAHPYTRALLGAVPDFSKGTDTPLATITDYSWADDAEELSETRSMN